MINLGLGRITRLVQALGNPTAALQTIHVAGTNGKGSVCAYIESVLRREGWKTGKYTSPHWRTPADAVCIDGRPLENYNNLYTEIKNVAETNNIDASPFELETATAFTAFKNHAVDMAVVEAGLGGRDDATNILLPENVRCSAITKIALDHETFLGTTLAAVTEHKAGIIKRGVSCVVDGSNPDEVLELVYNIAREQQAPLTITAASGAMTEQNRNVAAAILQILNPKLDAKVIETGMDAAYWPGRLQWLHDNLLLDGAHNPSGAKELRSVLDGIPRKKRIVCAFSRPADAILRELVTAEDSVVVTEFGSVQNMPWVTAEPRDTVATVARKYTSHVTTAANIQEALETTFDGLTVVCGSLYLVSQV